MILFAKLSFPITFLSLIGHSSVWLPLKVLVPPIHITSKLREVNKLLNVTLNEKSLGKLLISLAMTDPPKTNFGL